MPARRLCARPGCVDPSCAPFAQFCAPIMKPKKLVKSEKKEDTIEPAKKSSESSSMKSKKLSNYSSKSSSISSDSDDLFSRSASSSDSLFSSSSSSYTFSSSDQQVPVVIQRKQNKQPLVLENVEDEEEMVILTCNDPNCKDSSCNVQIVQSAGLACTDPNCRDADCVSSANSSLAPSSCTDPNCSGCVNGHSSMVRNTFLGLAGVILFAMIGYMAYLKMKARRSNNNAKNYSQN